MKELSEENLLAIYDLIFMNTHSDGFKKAEVKDLLFDKTYWLLERPKEGWYNSVMDYLTSIGYDKSLLQINEKIIPAQAQP